MSMKIKGQDFFNYDEASIFRTQAGISFEANDGRISLTLGDGTESGPHYSSYVTFKSPSEHCIDRVKFDLEMQVIMSNGISE